MQQRVEGKGRPLLQIVPVAAPWHCALVGGGERGRHFGGIEADAYGAFGLGECIEQQPGLVPAEQSADGLLKFYGEHGSEQHGR